MLVLKALLKIIVIFGLLIVTAACNAQLSEIKPRGVQGESIPSKGSESFITANTYPELSKKSTLIVIGRVAEIEGIINMARDPNDPTKPDRQVYVVGQIYKVQVKQILKGIAKEGIFIVQREGFLGSSVPKTESEIERSKANENYVPLVIDKDYLMFLEPMLGFPDGEYYVGVAQP
jgi:hypothetical protein